MAMTVTEQVRWWAGGLAVFLVAMYFIGGALAPYFVGAGIAYVMDPVADRLERWGLSRVWATVVITFSALIIFIVSLILLVPFLVDQVKAVADAVPGLFEALTKFLGERFPSLFQEDSSLRQALTDAQASVQSASLKVLNTVLTSSVAVLDFVLLLVVAPVVAFYLLLDWDNMIARINSWLPLDHAGTIRELAGEIDKTLASFLRGQLTVMAFLAIFYATGLSLIGLDFGVFVGMFAGLISFIPYVGTALGGAMALGLALCQFWGDWAWIGAVAAVFIAGQFIEGNILTPKLVGDSVGLHPVALMFALSAFGLIFGFVGLLIAVPVAASIGVLARFGLKQYLNGRLYKGQAGREAEAETE